MKTSLLRARGQYVYLNSFGSRVAKGRSSDFTFVSWFLHFEELSQSLDCVAQESETCDLFWLSEPFAESLNAGLLAQERGQEKDCCDVRAFSHFFSRRRREGASPDGAGESDLCLYARWTGQPYDHVPDLCLTL